ncbi:GntR family transcriptional regulator [Micromonospora sp. NPDC051925]|uniref:GntR family transcriptional regulator n=1 Tax=Micromonospora sp. NPDC051925 TaxID=3364288 RepID=UPI0037C7555B
MANLESAVRKLRAAQAGVPRAEERAARLIATEIDPVSPVPRYRQLAAILRTAIEVGQYPPGSRLPSEKTLTQTHGVARETASKGDGRAGRRGAGRDGSRCGLARSVR